MYHPYYHSPANHPHSLNPIHPHIQPSGIPAMHLPFTPCSHAAASSACFASTPAPSVLLATTLTLSAFLNSVPISSKYFNAPITGITLIRSRASMAHIASNFSRILQAGCSTLLSVPRSLHPLSLLFLL